MHLDVMDYYKQVEDYFEESKQNELYDIYDSLKFKINKNNYHFDNISRILSNSNIIEQADYYNDTHLPIYYEAESFIVSIRSSADILLHIINHAFCLSLERNEVTLYNVYHHAKLPKAIKTQFQFYTRPDNPTWNFIYTSRNMIVHEKSINHLYPVHIDLFTMKEPIAFVEVDGVPKEVLTFFGQCLRHMERFTSDALLSIKTSLYQEKPK